MIRRRVAWPSEWQRDGECQGVPMLSLRGIREMDEEAGGGGGGGWGGCRRMKDRMKREKGKGGGKRRGVLGRSERRKGGRRSVARPCKDRCGKSESGVRLHTACTGGAYSASVRWKRSCRD